MVLGHEGAGVVEEIGPGVTRVAPGDHVVCSFIPSCGSCHWCATGQQWSAAGCPQDGARRSTRRTCARATP